MVLPHCRLLRPVPGMTASTPTPVPPNRREFLSSSSRVFGGGWLALQLPALGSLAACAREAAERGEPLTTLSPREGAGVSALAEAILPSDDLPGAREAGVVHFVDGALGKLFPGMLEVIRPGLEDLEERARAASSEAGDIRTATGPDDSSFAALTRARQEDLIREVEDTPFFFLARMLVVMGMFSDPKHGGNRGRLGWELLDMAHAPAYEPPFGHYDAEYARQSEGGETPHGRGPSGPGTGEAS
jgi:gluconate 2-dehydrogenase gamma chain